MEKDQRLKIIYGNENVDNLKEKKVLIAGLGGVGSYACEAIARSFVKNIIIVDFDVYDITNLNRQLHSSVCNVGKYKVDIIEENIYNINHDAYVIKIKEKITYENIKEIIPLDIDFVIDCIDDIPAKIEMIDYCCKNKINIISSMGTGNKIHPEKLQINDIYKTSVCPLARKLRKELKDRQIQKLPVVFSTEEIIRNSENTTIGSTPFVPAVAGLLLSSFVVNKLTNKI